MKFVTPVDISHAVDATWTDVDLTSNLGADAGSVSGVILYIDNANGISHEVGVRKNGSTDDIRADVDGDEHITVPVGIDSSDIVEVYVDDASEISVYLLGYITDAEGAFDTNLTDKTPGTDSSWQDVDISSDTGGATATFAFFVAENVAPGNRTMGIRPNGSTDDVTADDVGQGDLIGGGIPVDGSEIFEVWLEDVTSGIDLYLAGWLTDNVTANTNATEYSVNSSNTWESKDVSGDLGASDVGGMMIASRGGGSSKNMSVRKPGDSVPGTSGTMQRYYGFAAVDASDQMELYTSGANGVEFYFYAGFAEPAGGGGVTGTAAQTLPSVIQTASGGLSFSATAAQTLPSVIQTASGSLIFTATADQTLASLTQSATGSQGETVSGSAAQALPTITQTASGSLKFSGTADQVLAGITQSASGGLTFTGTAAQTLSAIVQSASGTSGADRTGTVSQTLPIITQDAEGTLTFTATDGGQILPAIIQSASESQPVDDGRDASEFRRTVSISARFSRRFRR